MDEAVPVYKKIDGELIRIIGDKRDPSRRYSSVTDAEGSSYYLEFTDEEERQRDEEEAKWEAERPQREAEEKRQQEEAEKFRASLQYENRIVAFLDVLGWRSAINQSSTDPELTRQLGIALKTIEAHAQLAGWPAQETGQERWLGDPQITHFSDCILLSVIADRHAHRMLSFHLSGIVNNLLRLGFFVRGGIAVGPLIHRGSMAYGPALIRAHELESKHAKIGRIILDSPIGQAWGPGIPVTEKDGTLIGYQKTWRQDTDGLYFYDFIKPFYNMPGMPVDGSHLDQTFTPIRQLIISGLEKYKNSRGVSPKYQWLAKYFNQVLDEYPQCTLERIPILRGPNSLLAFLNSLFSL